jgi:hypothetical protein
VAYSSKPVDLGFGHIFEASELCIEQRLQLPALILIYVGIDIAGWLASRTNRGVRTSFTAFVEKYMLPGSLLAASPLDLYAARCAVLHTYTAESDLSAHGKARTIGYACGKTNAQDLQTSFARSGRTDMVAVHISDLFAAFRQGVDQLTADVSADVSWRKDIKQRKRKGYSDLPQSVLQSFLEMTKP